MGIIRCNLKGGRGVDDKYLSWRSSDGCLLKAIGLLVEVVAFARQLGNPVGKYGVERSPNTCRCCERPMTAAWLKCGKVVVYLI